MCVLAATLSSCDMPLSVSLWPFVGQAREWVARSTIDQRRARGGVLATLAWSWAPRGGVDSSDGANMAMARGAWQQQGAREASVPICKHRAWISRHTSRHAGATMWCRRSTVARCDRELLQQLAASHCAIHSSRLPARMAYHFVQAPRHRSATSS